MSKFDNDMKAMLLKESLMIVNELGSDEFEHIADGDTNPKNIDFEKLQNLISKAIKLRKNRLWKL